MKSGRRKSREDALQILYQLELNPQLNAEAAIEQFQDLYSRNKTEVDSFTKRLVLGVAEKRREIDQCLLEISSHWKPERMATVDKNILRLGVYEIKFCEDIPATVSVNEMVELAKEFGAENSSAFVNGILDKVKARFSSSQKAP